MGSTEIGVVADLCPACREPRAFALLRLRVRGGVPAGLPGSPGGTAVLRRCRNCGTEAMARLEDYRATHGAAPPRGEDSGGHLEAIIRDTRPALREEHGNRLSLIEAARRRTLDPERRRALLREPFLLLLPAAILRLRSRPLDSLTLGGCFAAVVLFLAILVAGGFLRLVPENVIPTWVYYRAALAVIFAGVIFTIWGIATGDRRYLRRKALPAIARALAPLDPEAAEIEETLAALRREGLPGAEKIAAGDLAAPLSRERGARE